MKVLFNNSSTPFVQLDYAKSNMQIRNFATLHTGVMSYDNWLDKWASKNQLLLPILYLLS